MKRIGAFLISIAFFLVAPAVSEGTEGSIIAWGYNDVGQCNVPTPNCGYIAIAAGVNHSFSLAIRADGSIEAWGDNGEGQCTVPSPNSNFIAIAGGSTHSLGLKENGSIVAWGDNDEGQCAISSPNSNYTAVSAGGWHSLGLKTSGSILMWGNNSYGQCSVPSPNSGYVAIDGGLFHSVALKSDGSVRAWGDNYFGQTDVPSPNSGFVAVSAGMYHCIGLKGDGSIVGWGYNDQGQCNPPSPNSGFVAISAGNSFNLGLKNDGSIVAWGHNNVGQCNVPSPNSFYYAIAAGASHGLGLKTYVEVTEPNSSTTWTHFDEDLSISWAGIYSANASITIRKGTTLVSTLSSFAPNTGSYIYEGPVPMVWEPGTDYRICIEDALGHVAYSSYFTVAPSQSAEVITVTEPNAATTWNNDEMNRTISWNYPALRTQDSGDTVSIKLYKNDVFVNELISGISNTGTWVFSDSLPATWENGSDYSVRVVDNLANYGSSAEFDIEIDTAIDDSDYLDYSPDEPCLFPISPNPSVGLLTISYFIPRASDATVAIYDISGKIVSEPVDDEHSSGLYEIQADGLSSGVYFCHLRTGSDSMTERFVVIR